MKTIFAIVLSAAMTACAAVDVVLGKVSDLSWTGMGVNKVASCGNQLPYDAEIEYLESTGTQYINTDFLWHSNVTVEVNFSVVSVRSQYQYIWGTSSPVNGLRYNGGNLEYFGALTTDLGYPPTSGVNYTFKLIPISRQSWGQTCDAYINGEKVASEAYANVGSATNPIRLWDMPYPEDYLAIAKIYYFKASDDFVSIDLVPVRVGTVGFMYDKITKKLFGNGGAGSFTLGPDKP